MTSKLASINFCLKVFYTSQIMRKEIPGLQLGLIKFQLRSTPPVSDINPFHFIVSDTATYSLKLPLKFSLAITRISEKQLIQSILFSPQVLTFLFGVEISTFWNSIGKGPNLKEIYHS